MISDFATGGAQDVMHGAMGGWNQALQTDPSQNPYFQNAVTAATSPIMKQFTEQALPSLRSGSLEGGTFGGSRRQMQEERMANDALSRMGDVAATMGNQAYGQGLQARTQALGMSPQMMAMGFTPGQMMQQEQWAPLQKYAGIIGGPAVLGGGSSGWNVGIPAPS
jgi:hypothetical protein